MYANRVGEVESNIEVKDIVVAVLLFFHNHRLVNSTEKGEREVCNHSPIA